MYNTSRNLYATIGLGKEFSKEFFDLIQHRQQKTYGIFTAIDILSKNYSSLKLTDNGVQKMRSQIKDFSAKSMSKLPKIHRTRMKNSRTERESIFFKHNELTNKLIKEAKEQKLKAQGLLLNIDDINDTEFALVLKPQESNKFIRRSGFYSGSIKTTKKIYPLTIRTALSIKSNFQNTNFSTISMKTKSKSTGQYYTPLLNKCTSEVKRGTMLKKCIGISEFSDHKMFRDFKKAKLSIPSEIEKDLAVIARMKEENRSNDLKNALSKKKNNFKISDEMAFIIRDQLEEKINANTNAISPEEEALYARTLKLQTIKSKKIKNILNDVVYSKAALNKHLDSSIVKLKSNSKRY